MKQIIPLILSILLSFNVFAGTEQCDSFSLPIHFSEQGLPIVELSLNGEKTNALLDLGSSEGIHLPKPKLDKITNVKYTGETVKSSNIVGEVVEAKAFVLPSLSVNCAELKNVSGLELVSWAASIGEGEANDDGNQPILGLGFFKGYKLTINYPKKSIQLDRVIDRSDRDNWHAFDLSAEGISIPLNSTSHTYQMVLDTGASSSIFVANKVNKKETVASCDFNLGPEVECKVFNSPLTVFNGSFQSNIILFPIDERFQKDGILGSDFFNQFVVELDLERNKIQLTSVSK